MTYNKWFDFNYCSVINISFLFPFLLLLYTIEKYPGYLRELFRYAIRSVGARSSFAVLAHTMNLKSDAPGESRETLTLHWLQLN